MTTARARQTYRDLGRALVTHKGRVALAGAGLPGDTLAAQELLRVLLLAGAARGYTLDQTVRALRYLARETRKGRLLDEVLATLAGGSRAGA